MISHEAMDGVSRLVLPATVECVPGLRILSRGDLGYSRTSVSLMVNIEALQNG